MERYTQIKVIAVPSDVKEALDQLNKELFDMEFLGHQIKRVEPLFDNPRLWLITYQKDDRGNEETRGSIEEPAK